MYLNYIKSYPSCENPKSFGLHTGNDQKSIGLLDESHNCMFFSELLIGEEFLKAVKYEVLCIWFGD